MQHGVAHEGHAGAGLLFEKLRGGKELDGRDDLAPVQQRRLPVHEREAVVRRHVVHVLEELEVVPGEHGRQCAQMKAEIRRHDDGIVRQLEAVAGQGVGVDAVLPAAFLIDLAVDLEAAADDEAFELDRIDGLSGDFEIHFFSSEPGSDACRRFFFRFRCGFGLRLVVFVSLVEAHAFGRELQQLGMIQIVPHVREEAQWLPYCAWKETKTVFNQARNGRSIYELFCRGSGG